MLVGGAEQLKMQRAGVIDSFSVATPGDNLLDALALPKEGKTVIVGEFKGATARLDSTPRPTIHEGYSVGGVGE